MDKVPSKLNEVGSSSSTHQWHRGEKLLGPGLHGHVLVAHCANTACGICNRAGRSSIACRVERARIRFLLSVLWPLWFVYRCDSLFYPSHPRYSCVACIAITHYLALRRRKPVVTMAVSPRPTPSDSATSCALRVKSLPATECRQGNGISMLHSSGSIRSRLSPTHQLPTPNFK